LDKGSRPKRFKQRRRQHLSLDASPASVLSLPLQWENNMARKPRVERTETAQERLERLRAEIVQAEADAAQEAEQNARMGPLAVANTVIFKASAAFLIEHGIAPDWLVSAPQQGYPREANIAKRYGMSETERANAITKARKAIDGL